MMTATEARAAQPVSLEPRYRRMFGRRGPSASRRPQARRLRRVEKFADRAPGAQGGFMLIAWLALGVTRSPSLVGTRIPGPGALPVGVLDADMATTEGPAVDVGQPHANLIMLVDVTATPVVGDLR